MKTLTSGLRLALLAVCLTLMATASGFAQTPRLVVQVGHAGEVSSVCYSPDGKILASSGGDGTVKLWDAATGLLLRTVTEQGGTTWSVAFSPNGRLLAVGCDDGAIQIVDPVTGSLVRALPGQKGATIFSVRFSPDGTLLAAGCRDSAVRLYRVSSGALVRTLVGHKDAVDGVAFSPDGTTVAAGSWDKTVCLWDAASGRLLHRLTGFAAQVGSVCFSPDGRTLACGSWDAINGPGKKTVQLWDVRSGAKVRVLPGAIGDVDSVCFSPDGRFLTAGTLENTVLIWDVRTGRSVRALSAPASEPGGGVNCVCYSPDGRTLASGNDDHTITLWNAATGQPLLTLAGHSLSLEGVCFSPDGKTLASASDDATVKLMDAATGQLVRTLRGHQGWVNCVCFSPDGTRIASGSTDDVGDQISGTVKVWDAATGNLLQTLIGHTGGVTSVCFSPDGKTLASASEDDTVRLWNAATGQLIVSLPPHPDWVISQGIRSVCFSPDGRRVAIGDAADNRVQLWDSSSGAVLQTFKEPTAVNCVCFSPDGRMVADGSDRGVKIWDTASGRLIHALAPNLNVFSVCFSRDGRTLASAAGSVVDLWDVDSGILLRTVSGALAPVASLCYSPDGTLLVGGTTEGSIFLASASGKLLCRLYGFNDDSWAVVDPAGRFDGDDGGFQNLHWVVGTEPIDLSELKDRFYEPGLLGDLLGSSKEPVRNVSAFNHVDLYPAVAAPPAVPADGKLTLHLTNQGGGIGRVQVFVNGKELTADARGPQPNPDAPAATLTVDVSHAPNLIPGRTNTVTVVTWNKQGYLRSRGIVADYVPPGEPPQSPPELYAVVVGSNYTAALPPGLRYPVQDAKNFAKTLELGAGDMLDSRVHIHLLTDDPAVTGDAMTTAGPATKDAIAAAFRDIQKQSRPQDVLVVFFAGHGVALTAHNSLYCYLTQDAHEGTPEALADDALRSATTVTSEDLAAWTNAKVMPPLKQVLVLDTCAAGAAKVQLALRSDSTDRIRAVDRLKDRVGFWVLMGCADNAYSYESDRFGDGVLTYALLQYVRQGNLPGGQIDVSALFQAAKDTVPDLMQSAGLGGSQDPQVIAPQADSFPIGHLTATEQAEVPLQNPRPLILRPELVALDTDLSLEALLVSRLQDQSAPRGDNAAPVLTDAAALPGALKPSGDYTVAADGAVTVTLYLRRDGTLLKKLTLTGNKANLDGDNGLVAQLAAAIDQAATDAAGLL